MQLDDQIGKIPIPAKTRLGKSNDEYISKSKMQINGFLQVILVSPSLGDLVFMLIHAINKYAVTIN